jgi:hypothetical protein
MRDMVSTHMDLVGVVIHVKQLLMMATREQAALAVHVTHDDPDQSHIELRDINLLSGNTLPNERHRTWDFHDSYA